MRTKVYKVATMSALLFVFSCASNREPAKPPHHHHSCSMKNCKMKHKCEMYGKKCAASVAHGDFHVEGKEDFKLTHEGHNYYFSSKRKMDEFKKNLDENVKKADNQWQAYERGFQR